MEHRDVTIEGHLRGLDADELQRVSAAIVVALRPNVRISPPYARDRGRPGYIVFITVWGGGEPGPRVRQAPREWSP